ncbi:nuclear factor of activated T-cells 5-like [Pollicipes pollicipes]|uniref:nuclear factor of activated T-cells 5-like n=1 Tax=Pollicipes pollicipes TaxID=41117 RepID=UPI0018858E8E|nr:nuclear factor of activated T-cells 5-like [Pollicipes pollicipes]
MLVEHISLEAAQQRPARLVRKRRARGVTSHGSRERTKVPRCQLTPVPITKLEPDEDSGLGLDEPGVGALETAQLIRSGITATVRGLRRDLSPAGGFVRDLDTTTEPYSPRDFLKGVNPVSKCGKYRLVLAREPETRHRARYQTEGSRGAVKDATGKTSPQVVLSGYAEPCQLQMYVGSDADGCSPHLFYQSCRVTGKTASPSEELVLNGTVVIQTTMTPEPDGSGVSARCDCLGILKQRNVDIESRVAEAGGPMTTASAGRRPSALRKGARATSCRLVFRVTIVNGRGQAETLQVASRSIICTQPQGIPEVTKLSLREAPCDGGLELIVLGKNFVKDSRVVFSEPGEGGAVGWTEAVAPHKDHTQAVHLVCDVPPYWDGQLAAPREVQLTVRSGDKERTWCRSRTCRRPTASCPRPPLAVSRPAETGSCRTACHKPP